MRVVLDTNVIISAFATRGLCAEIFELCVLNHTVITSEEILEEVSENLKKKLRLPDRVVQEITQYLREVTQVADAREIDESVCRDRDDLKVIGTAIGGRAEFLITGDKDLLVLKKYENVRILSPRAFWRIMKTGTG